MTAVDLWAKRARWRWACRAFPDGAVAHHGRWVSDSSFRSFFGPDAARKADRDRRQPVSGDARFSAGEPRESERATRARDPAE